MKARRKRIELRHNSKIKVKEENNFYSQHLWGKKIGGCYFKVIVFKII